MPQPNRIASTAQASASALSTASTQFRVLITAELNLNKTYMNVQVAVQLDSSGSVILGCRKHDTCVIRESSMFDIVLLCDQVDCHSVCHVKRRLHGDGLHQRGVQPGTFNNTT